LDDESRTFRIEHEDEGTEGADDPEADYAPGND
jgi:hypothetical protein